MMVAKRTWAEGLFPPRVLPQHAAACSPASVLGITYELFHFVLPCSLRPGASGKRHGHREGLVLIQPSPRVGVVKRGSEEGASLSVLPRLWSWRLLGRPPDVDVAAIHAVPPALAQLQGRFVALAFQDAPARRVAAQSRQSLHHQSEVCPLWRSSPSFGLGPRESDLVAMAPLHLRPDVKRWWAAISRNCCGCHLRCALQDRQGPPSQATNRRLFRVWPGAFSPW